MVLSGIVLSILASCGDQQPYNKHSPSKPRFFQWIHRQPDSYQTREWAGHKKPLAVFSFPGVLEEVVLTMSHCLTAPSPRLLGYSVTSNILPPARTTHGEWPGSTQTARRSLTKKSLTPCAERKGSTHIAQCHEAHSASCRSKDQESVGNFLHFCAASLGLKDAGWKISNPERMKVGFFFLPWTAASVRES